MSETEPRVAKCLTCNSIGFLPSVLGPDRCSFCDGTEGGNPPKGAGVLLDNASLEVARFGATDDPSQPYLGGINVLPDRVEATNGHFMIQVPHVGMDVAEFPVVPGDDGKSISEGGVLLPMATAKAVARGRGKRNYLPILALVKVGSDGNGGAVAVATDLETPVVVRGKIEGKFPDLGKVLVDGHLRPVRICLQAKYLKVIAEYALAVGEGRSVPVNLFVPTDGTASGDSIRFEIGIEGARKAIGVLMPMRHGD